MSNHSSRAGPLGAFELPVHGIEPYTSLPWHPLPWQSSKGYVFGTTETCDVHSKTPDGRTGQPELSGPAAAAVCSQVTSMKKAAQRPSA